MIDLNEIIWEDLHPRYQEVAKVIGLEAALKLGREFGGEQIYLPKLDGHYGALSRVRNRKILEELKNYQGSIVELARKYNVTSVWVYDLIRRERSKTSSN
ncbi:MAG: hypothetical protein A2511_08785 [Deltaproteobacteria bacterium RIFOXYD12_FULL_50_9]|nr:MAG: hypothetical protein A2511_08785 [Deltaproteobacteria bacterium RIFOXYD12_FULL_50_9]